MLVTVTNSLEAYDIYEALKPVRGFVEDLSAWYVRRSRKRQDRENFYETTYVVLTTLSKLLAPFTPFFAEAMWQNLGNTESIHLQAWPEFMRVGNGQDDKLEEQMNLVRQICELGNAKRKELKIKVRQPLAKLKIQNSKSKIMEELIQLIKDELNVKHVEFIEEKGEELAVEFDTTITPELKAEGEARELIRSLQELRKKAGLQINDFVNAEVTSFPAGFEEMIKREVLIKNLKKVITGENKIERVK